MSSSVISSTTSTVIVAPRALLREGIVSVLQNTPYRIMAGAAGPEELWDIHCPNEGPILGIIGIDGGNENLEEAGRSIQLLRSLIPNGKIVLVVEASGPIDLHSVLALAPDGCILNPRSREILVKALELTLMDQQVFVLAQSMPMKIRENSDIHTQERSGNSLSCDSRRRVIDAKTVRLSQRERQVLVCLAQGKSNKVISRLCGIAEATVKAHLKAILRKTNAHNRTQAAIWAIQHGFQAHALTEEGNLAVDPTPQAAE